MFSLLAAFGYGLYCFYQAIKYYRLFKSGIHATATVIDIELEIHSDPEVLNKESYYLILQLPSYQGIPMGKKYEMTIRN
jgi:hypothetical protein